MCLYFHEVCNTFQIELVFQSGQYNDSRPRDLCIVENEKGLRGKPMFLGFLIFKSFQVYNMPLVKQAAF